MKPFLGNGREINNRTSFLGNRFLIMQQLVHNNGRAVFCTWSVLRVVVTEMVWGKQILARMLSLKSGHEERTLCVIILFFDKM
jgi:hypothetical protein